MTKQEELFWLHTLQTNIQVINDLEEKLEDNEAEKEKAIMREIEQNSPDYPEKAEPHIQDPKHNSIRSNFIFIPGAFVVLFIIAIACAINADIPYKEKIGMLMPCMGCVLGAIFASVLFYMSNETARKASYFGLFNAAACAFYGFMFLPIISILLLIVLIAFIVVYRLDKKAQANIVSQNEQAKKQAEIEYMQALRDFDRIHARLEREAKKKYDNPSSSFMVKEKELRQQLEQCRSLLNANAILHQDYKDIKSVDRIIQLMETGVADSIKEALQIMLQENQRHSQWKAEQLMNQWEREERRKAEAERAREQFYQNMELQRLEHERIDQAKRAADELEEIRKKLEGK